MVCRAIVQTVSRPPPSFSFVSLTILAHTNYSFMHSLIYLYRRLVLDPEDYERFAHFNPSKNYTRNLIATDDERFTLLLLCWNPNKASPIHDHPCDGCWMRVVCGKVQECRYVQSSLGEEDALQCVSNEIYKGMIACGCRHWFLLPLLQHDTLLLHIYHTVTSFL